MKFEEIQEILNRQLLKLENCCLNDTEQLLLRGLWQKKTYQEIEKMKPMCSISLKKKRRSSFPDREHYGFFRSQKAIISRTGYFMAYWIETNHIFPAR